MSRAVLVIVRRCRAGRVLAGLAVLVGSGYCAAQASAYVYWASSNQYSIGRANLDGSAVNEAFIGGASSPDAVAVDGEHVYWSNNASDSIGRANLDGTDVNQSFITGGNDLYAVAVNARYVFWVNYKSNTIGRANLDGTDVNQAFVTGASGPVSVAADGQHVYWANQLGGTIGRANVNGTDANEGFITGASNTYGVAVDAQHLYWDNVGTDTLGRANLNGTDVNQSFMTGVHAPFGIAVGGHFIYWADTSPDVIKRANADGTGVKILTAVKPVAEGLAVDSGASVSPGTLSVSPTSLSMPTLPVKTIGAPKTLTVTDTGQTVVHVTAVQVASGDVHDFLISKDTCEGAHVQPAAACSIAVRFAPSAAGPRSAMLTVTTSAGPLQIALSGSGAAVTSSMASITGVAAAAPKLAFTLSVPGNTPPFQKITVTLPSGIRFASSPKTLASNIAVTSSGTSAPFTGKVNFSLLTLTITLTTPASNATLAIASPELVASKLSAHEVATGKRNEATHASTTTVTNTQGTSTLPLNLAPT